MRISELAKSRDGIYNIEDIFVYRMAGYDDNGRAQGAFYATGYEPDCLRRLAAAGIELPTEMFSPRELRNESVNPFDAGSGDSDSVIESDFGDGVE